MLTCMHEFRDASATGWSERKGRAKERGGQSGVQNTPLGGCLSHRPPVANEAKGAHAYLEHVTALRGGGR